MASTVQASHLPLGLPLNEPSLASAVCISEIRSAAGAFWPRSRRVVFLVDFAWRVLAPGFVEDGFEVVAPCPAAAAPLTPIPAATSSVRARWVAFRTRMGFGLMSCGRRKRLPESIAAGSPPERH